MQIQFHGAAQTVTGSQFLLIVNGKKLLIDCGLYQGKRSESYQRNLTFSFDPALVDAALLTHAHIDHSGNLPNLVKNGYVGPIYTTSATAQLADVMLRDSAHIQEADAEYINKHNLRRGEPLIEPVYTLADAVRVAPHFQKIDYNAPLEILPGVTATLFDAGHILGSAGIQLDIQEDGQKSRVWFSGDIGRRNMPLLRDPVLPKEVDFLVMECTYGDSQHDDPLKAFEEFQALVKRTVKRGGKVIIPAFAVGRTQELVYSIHQGIEEGNIPPIPVYVDSPLAVEATKVFMEHPECYDAETLNFIREGNHPALNFKQLTYVGSVEESKSLNGMKGPMVIISASGMAETGRILHHLKNNIEDKRNMVMIVSYQAPETLGRKLADGAKKVRIFGEDFDVNAEVVSINGFSAHAGQDALLKYARSTADCVEEVMLVHAEEDAASTFRGLLQQSGIENVAYPMAHQSIEL